MTDNRRYREFHPRWYRPKMSTWWWLERPSSLVFILRELSSVFVGWFVVFLLLLIGAVDRGEAAYQEFLGWAARPGLVVLNLVSLFFLIFHAVTWFNLAPKAIVLRVGGKRISPSVIAASNYAAWVGASAIVAWLILRP